ncbi:MAG: CUAEP/CCAEP-tail radical SAM protein, partial [Gammaproteobacteria bacterium]|nr:CUAEP/CCAEP-tail radical SAM protein [Gammaproteobacteria bacterium]
MKITLVNPYELGRQPFGLAEPAAFLKKAGFDVSCCDLSIQKLDSCLTAGTAVVAIYIAMHTATRIAIEALPKIRELLPQASLCVYG